MEPLWLELLHPDGGTLLLLGTSHCSPSDWEALAQAAVQQARPRSVLLELDAVRLAPPRGLKWVTASQCTN